MKERVIEALKRTWNNISGDVAEVEASLGNQSISKDIVVEMTTDANRLEMYGNDAEAVKYFRDLSFHDQNKISQEAFPLKWY